MKWIFEKDFLDGDHKLMGAATKQGHEVRLVDRYGSERYDKKPTIFRGHLPFYYHLQKEKVVPGWYCTLANYCCSMYYPRLHRYLLNKDYYLLPWGSLFQNFDMLAEKAGPLFIKPNGGNKAFTGEVVSNKYHLQSLDLGASMKPETLVFLSSAKPIEKEYRFVVCDKKVVAGSLYKPHEEGDAENGKAGLFAKYLVKDLTWQPDPVFTLDICEMDGKMYVLELNSFSCAGLYETDPHKVVKAVSARAEQDFKDFYE